MEQSFGQILKKNREDQKLSIKQVSVAIKMNASLIQDLEEENFKSLPKPVFLRGLIKAYCKYLEIDEKDVLELFDNTTKYKKTTAKRVRLQESEVSYRVPLYVMLSKFFIPVFVISAIGLAITGIIYITHKYEKEKNTVVNENIQAIHTAKKSDSENNTVLENSLVINDLVITTDAEDKTSENITENSGLVAESSDTQFAERITLEPLAKALVYVKIDEGENQKIILRPDINRTFQAQSKIKIKLMDAGAINIIYNNKDLGVPGVFGEEVELVFPPAKEN